MFPLLLASIVLGATAVMFYMAAKPAKKEAAPVKKVNEFLTRDARLIWENYKELPEEFKRFPDLKQALILLDKTTNLKKRVNAPGTSYGELIHDRDCKDAPRRTNYHHDYSPSIRTEDKKTETCSVCAEYKAYSSAVSDLLRANRARQARIEENRLRDSIQELETRRFEYSSLAELMREEARIAREVTNQVYKA